MDDVKKKIQEEFKKWNTDKNKIVNYINEFANNADTKEVFELKKYLETRLTKDISCTYMPLRTTDDYGCDLREIFYNRKGGLLEDTKIRNDLLNIFNKKKDTECFHILTDIDDTLFAHPGGIAGNDYSWTKKQPYPGIKEFYAQFYQTIHDENKKYTTVLSATPGFAKTLKLDNEALKAIIGENYGFIQGEESKSKQASTIGDLIFQRPDQSRFTMYGDIKARRCKEYKSLFPEFKLIFIGDNGQGDLLAGQQMIDNNICKYVFIHNIMDNKGDFKKSTIDPKYKPNIYLFKNYLELAYIFKNLSIFKDANVKAILDSIPNDIGSHSKQAALPIQKLINSIRKFYPNSMSQVLASTVGGKKKKRTKKGRKMNKKKRTRKIIKNNNIKI